MSYSKHFKEFNKIITSNKEEQPKKLYSKITEEHFSFETQNDDKDITLIKTLLFLIYRYENDANRIIKECINDYFQNNATDSNQIEDRINNLKNSIKVYFSNNKANLTDIEINDLQFILNALDEMLIETSDTPEQ